MGMLHLVKGQFQFMKELDISKIGLNLGNNYWQSESLMVAKGQWQHVKGIFMGNCSSHD